MIVVGYDGHSLINYVCVCVCVCVCVERTRLAGVGNHQRLEQRDEVLEEQSFYLLILALRKVVSVLGKKET